MLLNLPSLPLVKGGPGSGHFGHGGRPGQRGGSASVLSGSPGFSDEANAAASEFNPTLKQLMKRAKKDKQDWTDFHMSSDQKAEVAGITGSLAMHTDSVWNAATHSMAQSQLQKAAAEEFGADFPEWQQKQLKAFEVERGRRLAAGEELDSKTVTITEMAYDHVERLRASPTMRDKVVHIKKPSDLWGEHKSEEAAMKSYLRTTYDRTQADLAKAGITEISVYRGMRTKDPIGSVGDHVELKTQAALVSWTPSSKTATYFATLKKTKQKVKLPPSGTILKMTIPAKRVFSTPWTGLGYASEQEYVVLGKGRDVAAIHSNH